jgi:Na+-translocating ferredoxin:NAD+ oxidoreductase subunit D
MPRKDPAFRLYEIWKIQGYVKMSEFLSISIAPHIKSKNSTKKIIWAVILSLVPSGAAGVFIFGIKSLYIIAASVLSAVITEWVMIALRKKDITIFDGSAILTGLLLSYNLSPKVPLWLPAAGAFFAIAIGKQAFGGLGHNIFNPALVGRAFLMVSWPVYMTLWQNPAWNIDAVTSATYIDTVTAATPLALYKHTNFKLLSKISYWHLFIGDRGGCIGEVCIAALLLGALYLLWKKYISWHIPICYIATVALSSWAFNGRNGFFTGDALFFILSGGLILGAFFMATDYITSPLSPNGKIIFGIGCGILTFIIRRFAGYPEGVSYSILMMNALVPIIDRYTFPKWFGCPPAGRAGRKI